MEGSDAEKHETAVDAKSETLDERREQEKLAFQGEQRLPLGDLEKRTTAREGRWPRRRKNKLKTTERLTSQCPPTQG